MTATTAIPSRQTAPVGQFHDQKRALRMQGVPISRRKLFERVYSGKASPRSAIKAFCQQCLNFNENDIRTCTAPACPLFEYRPYRVKT